MIDFNKIIQQGIDNYKNGEDCVCQDINCDTCLFYNVGYCQEVFSDVVEGLINQEELDEK